MLWIKWFKITKEIRFSVYCRCDLRSGTFDKTWRGKGKLLGLWSCSAQEFSLKQLWQMISMKQSPLSLKKNIINVLLLLGCFTYYLIRICFPMYYDNSSFLKLEITNHTFKKSATILIYTTFEECYYTVCLLPQSVFDGLTCPVPSIALHRTSITVT